MGLITIDHALSLFITSQAEKVESVRCMCLLIAHSIVRIVSDIKKLEHGESEQLGLISQGCAASGQRYMSGPARGLMLQSDQRLQQHAALN